MIANARNGRVRGDYVCPACAAELEKNQSAYHCVTCGKVYPVLFGIPDFRLNSDSYLSIDDERAKAKYLYEYGRSNSFNELICEYYRVTDDVPDDIAKSFISYVERGPARGETILSGLFRRRGGEIIDIGCASGGFLIAAAQRGLKVVGVDIALRWLVICAKRLEENGLDVELVCADIVAPPFPKASFSTAIAADLLEHLPAPLTGARAIADTLTENASLYVSGANRYTLAPYPLAGLWGVGFLPKPLRTRYVTARRGIDTLRNARLLSPLGAAKIVTDAGFKVDALGPLDIPMSDLESFKGYQRIVARTYSHLRTAPIARQLMLATGPAFELYGCKLSKNAKYKKQSDNGE